MVYPIDLINCFIKNLFEPDLIGLPGGEFHLLLVKMVNFIDIRC